MAGWVVDLSRPLTRCNQFAYQQRVAWPMLTNQSAVQLVLTFLDGKALIMAVDLLHSIIVKSAVRAKLGSSASK
jgi:hypothetical protein